MGFDAKYMLTPSLSLDLTYNTDFAQVEADDVQVNLDRFSIFLPEKDRSFSRMQVSFRLGIREKLNYFLVGESALVAAVCNSQSTLVCVCQGR